MTKSVAIIGSVSSRYVFEYDCRNYFRISSYLEGILPFIHEKTDQSDYAKRLLRVLKDSDWKQSQLKSDISGTILDRVLDVPADLLVMDFNSIFSGILECESDGTKEYYLPYSINFDREGVARKNIYDLDKGSLKNRFREFLDRISAKYPPKQLVLVKTHVASYEKERYGDAVKDNNENKELTNRMLDEMFSWFEEYFSDASPYVIDARTLCVSDRNHPFGRNPLNYLKQFYEYSIECIYAIADGRNVEDVPLPEISLKHSRYALIYNGLDRSSPVESLGGNTGNLAFWSSIIHLFEPDCVPYWYKSLNIDLGDYDAIILTDLIWINEEQDYSWLKDLVQNHSDRIVVMSVGLQSRTFKHKFKLHESVVEILKLLSSKRTIGVRGKYTASVLRKYGIDNIQIIGCPSMYYWNNRNLKISSDTAYPHVPVVNFRSIYGDFSAPELKLFDTFVDSKSPFIEQNDLDYTECPAIASSKSRTMYLEKYKRVYCSNISWMKGIWNYTHSIGMRFHANVIALRAGLPALFITHDTRTKEMTDFFHLPSVSIKNMPEYSTLDDLIDLIDYSDFNENYPRLFDNFLDFLHKNGMEIKTKTVLEFDRNAPDTINHRLGPLTMMDLPNVPLNNNNERAWFD